MEVSLKDATQILDLMVSEGPRRVTACIEGPAGVGKSSIVRQFCAEREYYLVEVNTAAAITEPGDILGMPMKDNGKTIYAPVFWALQCNTWAQQIIDEKSDKKVILSFDDFNRVPAQVLQSMMSIFLDYKVGALELLPPVRIVLTGNPSNSREYAARALDKAQSDRIQSILVRFDLDQFISYGIRNQFNPEWLTFCKAYPEMFMEIPDEKKKKGSGIGSISPRTAEFASQALNTIQFRNLNFNSDISRIRLDAVVGEHIRASFFTHLKTLNRILTADEILAGKIREDVFAEMIKRPDLIYLTYIRLATHLTANEPRLVDKDIKHLREFIIRVEQDEINALFLRVVQENSKNLSQRILDADTFQTLKARLWGS